MKYYKLYINKDEFYYELPTLARVKMKMREWGLNSKFEVTQWEGEKHDNGSYDGDYIKDINI